MQPGLRLLGDAGEDIGKPGLGVGVVELRGADQGVHHGRPLAAAIGAGEEPGFASETDAAKRPLRGIVREADLTVVEEAGEALPAFQHVVHRLGHGGVPREPGTLGAHPVFELRDERRAPLPAHREAPLGGLAVDHALDIEQRVDAPHSLQRQRRDRRRTLAAPLAGRNVGEFIKLASPVCPTERFRDGPRRSAGLVEPPVAGVGVGLQDPCEAPKMLDRVIARTVSGVAE